MQQLLTTQQLFDALAAAAPNHSEREVDGAGSFAVSRDTIMSLAAEHFGDEFTLEQKAELEGFLTQASPQLRLDQAWAELLPALRRYTPTRSEEVADSVVVKSLSSATCAAFAMDASDGGLIVVDAATHDLTYQIVKGALSSWAFDETDVRANASTVARTVRVTLGNLRYHGQLWQPFDIRLTGERWLVAVEVIEAAMAFILAHEYAHIALGHTKDADRRLNFGPDAGVADCTEKQQELAADIFATNVVVNPNRSDRVGMDECVYKLLGIKMALEAIDLLDDCFFVNRSVGHPRPDLRFGVVLHACGLAEVARGEGGPLAVLSVAEHFRNELKQVDTDRGDLFEAVSRDPLIGLAHEYEDETLRLIRTLEHLESVIALPPSVAFSWLANLVFEPTVLTELDPLIRAAADEQLDKMEVPTALDRNAQRAFLVKSPAGLAWLLGSLPRWKDPSWAASFLSPSPGRPYYVWLAELSDIVSDDIFGAVAVCVQHLRNRWPRPVLPFDPDFVELIDTWVRLLCMDRVRPGVLRIRM